MFSICTTFVSEGKLEETVAAMAAAEEEFTVEKGVRFRLFVQCIVQPHIIWTVTEWASEKHHNDAAQSIMKTRRDDRIASILFGPEPYFEIFCDEDAGLSLGEYSAKRRCIVVAHGLVSSRAATRYRALQRQRVAKVGGRIEWLRLYRNRYNAEEFVALLSFADERSLAAVGEVESLRLEEYLFTGLRKPLGMSYLAGYNQFVCVPLVLTDAGSGANGAGLQRRAPAAMGS
jgi:hypothetical protein